jgi:hypothetical protein
MATRGLAMSDFIASGVRAVQAAFGWSDGQLLTAVRTLAAVAVALSFISVVFAVRRMRRPMVAQARPILLGFAGTLLASALYIFLMGPPLNMRLALPLFTAGAVIGLLQGWQTRLYWSEDILVAQRSALYVGLWGFAFIATQSLAQLQSAALHASGLLVMAMTVGIGAGSTVNLLLREAWMRRRGHRTAA